MENDIPVWLKKYAEYMIIKYDYDSSHDMTHFINTYVYAKQILLEDFTLETSIIDGINWNDIQQVIYFSAFSHDLIDCKYVKPQEALTNLKQVFHCHDIPDNLTEIICYIIDNMSFSKEKTRTTVSGTPIKPEYQIALNIVADADKLDAYRIERVIAYQSRRHSSILNFEERHELKLRWLKTILVKRVLEYRSKWLKTKCALRLSEEMHNRVQKYVDENLQEVQMFDY